jgi:hypothetical protein
MPRIYTDRLESAGGRGKNVALIMKDGKIYKNTTQKVTGEGLSKLLW